MGDSKERVSNQVRHKEVVTQLRQSALIAELRFKYVTTRQIAALELPGSPITQLSTVHELGEVEYGAYLWMLLPEPLLGCGDAEDCLLAA